MAAKTKTKDIFRASELSLLGVSNSHVDKDSKKIAKGNALSPLLLVRDPSLGKVVIADGYHRMCAIYLVNEDALIRCKNCLISQISRSIQHSGLRTEF